MKRQFPLLAMLALMACCGKSPVDPIPSGELVFSATMEQFVPDNGKSPEFLKKEWTAGDRIVIGDGSKWAEFEASMQEGASSLVFKRVTGQPVLSTESGTVYSAYYPVSIAPVSGSGSLLQKQQNREGAQVPGAPSGKNYVTAVFSQQPMYCQTEGRTLNFLQLCSILRLDLSSHSSQDDVFLRQIMMQSPLKSINGPYVIEGGTAKTTSLSSTTVKNSSYNVNAKSLKYITEYYISVPEGEYSNVEFVFQCDDGRVDNVVCEDKLVFQRGGITTKSFLLDDFHQDDNCNVTGTVTCEGKPVSGVWVCDGVLWTQTDANGKYRMESDKKAGYVYIQTPSGYEVPLDGAWPKFWKTLSGAHVKETADFELKKVDDNRHIALMSADWQLRALPRTPMDCDQARAYFTEVGNFAKAQSVPVFAVALGDQTWDVFWSKYNFDLSRFRQWAWDFPVPFYNVIGNHDHDMTAADDYSAAGLYRKIIGPENFSFDRGKVHYIIMDNVDYEPSDRSCEEQFTAAQLTWLYTDLSHVAQDTPIIFCVHIPMHGWGWNGSAWKAIKRGKNYSDALDMLKKYSTVHIFSGHSHLNEAFDCKAEGFVTNAMFEHKLLALGGDMWLSGQTIGYNIARDGVPSGHEIVMVDGKDIKVNYCGLSKAESHQSRAYSMSSVKKYWETNEKVKNFVASNEDFAYEKLYVSVPEGAVLVNLFNGDPTLNYVNIEVKDNAGNTLSPKMCAIKDPQSVVALESWWWYKEKSLFSASYQTVITPHILYVTPSSKATSLSIKIRNNSGTIISEKTYSLPIEFNPDEY